MTDHIKAALDRLTEYAAGNPNHDTDEIVRAARAELKELEDSIVGLTAAAESLYFDNVALLDFSDKGG